MQRSDMFRIKFSFKKKQFRLLIVFLFKGKMDTSVVRASLVDYECRVKNPPVILSNVHTKLYYLLRNTIPLMKFNSNHP